MNAGNYKLVFTVSEASTLLNLERGKIYLMIQEKLLDGFKVGCNWRIKRQSLEKFVQNLMLIFTIFLLVENTAHAAGSGMPWEGPLDQLLTSLAGPVARTIGVAAIIVTGLGIAFGEGGGGMRKMLWVVFGLTIAFSATSFFLSFFGGATGVVF